MDGALDGPLQAGGGAVLMHAAGNAANDDDSQFGDYVYNRDGELPASQPLTKSRMDRTP